MSKAEIIEWRDKTNGQMRSAPMLRHTVEVGSASVTVNERVPDGTKLEDIHIPFVKGDTVVLSVDEWASAKGLVTCRGKLEKLQAGSPGIANPVGPKR